MTQAGDMRFETARTYCFPERTSSMQKKSQGVLLWMAEAPFMKRCRPEKMIKNMRIRAAGSADMQVVSQVLRSCGLPVSDIDLSSRLCSLAVLGENVVGCASGELYEETVVIQFVAILDEYRGHHVASHLVRSVLMRARANGCTRATVLTPEHPAFFARFGFTLTAAAGDKPQEMQLSKEFVRRFGARTHYMCRRLE